MANYTITHICGHSAIENIEGTNTQNERENRAKYLSSRLCEACYRAEKLAEAQSEGAELPTLTGSDKQVAWASTLRAEAFKSLDTFVADTKVRVGNALKNGKATQEQADKALNEVLDGAEKARQSMTSQTQAAYWIDRRGNSGLSYIKEAISA